MNFQDTDENIATQDTAETSRELEKFQLLNPGETRGEHNVFGRPIVTDTDPHNEPSTCTEVEYLPYRKYELPQHPGPLDYTLFFPRSTQMFFLRLSARFGWRTLAIAMAVYGCQQGWGQSWSGIASYWYLLSGPPQGLGWKNTKYTVVTQFANIPWQIKAVYGMVSDTFPLFGRPRSPYIAGAALLGIAAYMMLALDVFTSPMSVGVLLLLASLAQASPDVMVDASIAEMSKKHPFYATDLQTLCWGSYFLMHCLVAQPGAYIQKFYGPQVLFFSVSVTCVVVLYPAARGWLGDVAPPPTQDQPHGVIRLRNNFSHPTAGPVFRLALFVTSCSLAQGFVGNAVGDGVAAVVGATTALLMCAGIWHWGRQVSPLLAKATVFIFMHGIFPPSTSVLMVWLKETNDPGDANCGSVQAPHGSDARMWYETKWCHQCSAARDYLEAGLERPCFDAPFLSILSVVGSFFGLLGTAVYKKYFGNWRYKSIFYFVMLASCVVSFLDLIWVH